MKSKQIKRKRRQKPAKSVKPAKGLGRDLLLMTFAMAVFGIYFMNGVLSSRTFHRHVVFDGVDFQTKHIFTHNEKTGRQEVYLWTQNTKFLEDKRESLPEKLTQGKKVGVDFQGGLFGSNAAVRVQWKAAENEPVL